ncbi:hypothetical protein IFR05_015342 [Cadophora sp. M221]|nr:hypothetical protein IFR05_015342 [Cadophora sp. M221]
MTDYPPEPVEEIGPPEVKVEPSLAHTMIPQPSSYTPSSHLTSDNASTSVTPSQPTIPLWKNSPGKTRVQKVVINEEAAEHFNRYFMAVKKILQNFSHINSSQGRLNEIKGIYSRKRECKVRIGFLGGTGTGKSSLINGLLMERVLPRSEEAASTAVPVEVSYNDSEDPNAVYRAYIEGISGAEFTKELEELFADKLAWDQGAGKENEEIDFDMLQRMTATLSKIKCLFPKLQTLDDLKSTSVQELLGHPEVQRLLDSKQDITSNNLPKFTEAIKRYIEANKPDTETESSIQRISL